jgi:hypothetical protein
MAHGPSVHGRKEEAGRDSLTGFTHPRARTTAALRFWLSARRCLQTKFRNVLLSISMHAKSCSSEEAEVEESRKKGLERMSDVTVVCVPGDGVEGVALRQL